MMSGQIDVELCDSRTTGSETRDAVGVPVGALHDLCGLQSLPFGPDEPALDVTASTVIASASDLRSVRLYPLIFTSIGSPSGATLIIVTLVPLTAPMSTIRRRVGPI